MGGGDVKVAGLLGLYLGFAGWGCCSSARCCRSMVPPWRRRAAADRPGSRGSVLPFGPFLLAGALIAILIHGSPT